MFSKWRHAENISKEKENFIFSLSHTIATAYLPGGSPQPGASPCRQIFSTFSDRRFCLSPHTENTRSFSLPLRLEYYSEISRHVIFFHIENTILPRMRSISRCNASRCLRVKIICVMHYVNMFYIYGTHTHTHTWSRTYAACTYTHVEHVHTGVHWKRTSYASVKNSSGRSGEILGAFTDGSSLLGMVGGGTCTWGARGSVTALLRRRKARRR